MCPENNETVNPVKNLGWRVVFAGLGINLALGVLYSWSVVKVAIQERNWGWTDFQRSLPYSVACLVFALIMVPAGRLQDKKGPRLAATIGGVLVGIGLLVTGLVGNSLTGYIIGFGLLVGAGIGFGYASATPPAVKWFPKAKTGLIAGIVVSGFGLASVYTAPLCKWLSSTYGLGTMMIVLGIGFFIVVGGLAQILSAPPAGFVPEGDVKAPAATGGPAVADKDDFFPSEMLKTWQFYALWFMYASGAGVGLMIISSCMTIAGGMTAAVMGLALGNGAGRIVAGKLSDRLGRNHTLLLFFIIQALTILGFWWAGRSADRPAVMLILLAALAGANYGSNLSLFPSITKDFYGLKNFGMNYGLVFTAWGVGGFLLSQYAGYVFDRTSSYAFAFKTSIVLLVIAGAMTFLIRPPRRAS
ncbi:MAG: MFS transporter [Lentisphaerales bacterium]|jgi:OFA family oxalate/formate antiporter-like MFS transporter|nr:MAG: MFS transporter [Lentisphaerales bacterium]